MTLDRSCLRSHPASAVTQAGRPDALRGALPNARLSALAGAVVFTLVIGMAACATPVYARSSLLDSINRIRSAGCGGGRGISVPLRSSRQLDAIAKRVSRGEPISRALSKVDYRALHTATVVMSNAEGNDDIARTLAKRACRELRDESVTEIGVEQRGDDVWLVLAQPFGTPELKDSSTVTAQILTLANQARARGRRCGGTSFASVPPLNLEQRLNEAARAQARDMARRSVLEHEGSDGSTVATRVVRQGYTWRTVGENIASGPTSAEEVMEGWLASPGHCANIMNPRFTDMGIAYVVDSRSESGVYWSQVFAAPK